MPEHKHPLADHQAITETATSPTEDALTQLLQQPAKVHSSGSSSLPTIVLGNLARINEDGKIWITLTEQEQNPVPALSLHPLTPDMAGRCCAIQFINGDPASPLIMGLLQQSPAPADNPAENTPHQALPIKVSTDGKQVEIAAAQELVLRCGESCIILTADGLIEIRAPYIDSHALAIQRLRGGSVQVN